MALSILSTKTTLFYLFVIVIPVTIAEFQFNEKRFGSGVTPRSPQLSNISKSTQRPGTSTSASTQSSHHPTSSLLHSTSNKVPEPGSTASTTFQATLRSPDIVSMAKSETTIPSWSSSGRSETPPPVTSPMSSSSKRITTTKTTDSLATTSSAAVTDSFLDSTIHPPTPTLSSASSSSIGSPTKGANLGAIIGGVVGGIVFAALLALVGFLGWSRNRRTRLASAVPSNFQSNLMVKPQERPVNFSALHMHLRSIASSKYSFTEKRGKLLERYSLSAGASTVLGDEHWESSEKERGSEKSFNSEKGKFDGVSAVGARTDRQMQLVKEIQKLKSQMIFLSDGLEKSLTPEGCELELECIRKKIKQLEDLEFSDWALERTDSVP